MPIFLNRTVRSNLVRKQIAPVKKKANKTLDRKTLRNAEPQNLSLELGQILKHCGGGFSTFRP